MEIIISEKFLLAHHTVTVQHCMCFFNLQALKDLHHRHRKTSIMIQWKEFIKHPLRFTIYHSIHLRFRNFNQRELKYFTNQPQGLQVWFLIFIWTIYCYFLHLIVHIYNALLLKILLCCYI